MPKMPDINSAWNAIFTDFNILEKIQLHGFVDVESPELNEYFQSRLLCKIDFKEKLPSAFKDNSLSILALSNGVYRIAPTNPFFKLDIGKLDNISIKTMVLPGWIETINLEKITSESQALDAAAASGILEDFTGRKTTLTVRGRKRCDPFILKLPSTHPKLKVTEYPITGVQIEIDGGYEDADHLILIEAKNTVSETMNLRQLIYPQLHFENSLTKTVSTTVMFYCKKSKIFNFIPVAFDAAKVILNYADVKRYELKEAIKPPRKKTLSALDLILPITGALTDVSAPFPQANDLDKVLDAYDILLERNSLSKSEVFEDLPVSVVGRQYDYYINVLKWMKLITIDQGTVELTKRGQEIGALDTSDKLKALQRIFLSDTLVSAMLSFEIDDINQNLITQYRISGSTPARRQSTVKKWDAEFKERIAV